VSATATERHIHRWVDSHADPDEWCCMINNCDARYPKGWTVGDEPTVATTPALVTSVRGMRIAEGAVAAAERALRDARSLLHRQRDIMHTAGAAAGVDNSVPSRRWPDIIEWVRRMDDAGA
jgi:hypothetical protein